MRNVLFSVISLTYKYFRTSQIKNCRNRKKVCICHNCYDNLLTWKWNMLENARKSCRMLWFFTKTTCTKNELPKSLKIIKTRLISMPRRKAISWCEAQVNIADAAVHICFVLNLVVLVASFAVSAHFFSLRFVLDICRGRRGVIWGRILNFRKLPNQFHSKTELIITRSPGKLWCPWVLQSMLLKQNVAVYSCNVNGVKK